MYNITRNMAKSDGIPLLYYFNSLEFGIKFILKINKILNAQTLNGNYINCNSFE